MMLMRTVRRPNSCACPKCMPSVDACSPKTTCVHLGNASQTFHALQRATTGRYTSEDGASAPEVCAPGSSSTLNGNNVRTSCQSCAAGKYKASNDGAINDECESCPSGSTQPATGQAHCTFCAKGSATSDNTVACASCPAGHYQDVDGALPCALLAQQTSCPTPDSALVPGSVNVVPQCKKCTRGRCSRAPFTFCLIQPAESHPMLAPELHPYVAPWVTPYVGP